MRATPIITYVQTLYDKAMLDKEETSARHLKLVLDYIDLELKADEGDDVQVTYKRIIEKCEDLQNRLDRALAENQKLKESGHIISK